MVGFLLYGKVTLSGVVEYSYSAGGLVVKRGYGAFLFYLPGCYIILANGL
jgi:hypothetical protein